jgi:putative acetyltransferase
MIKTLIRPMTPKDFSAVISLWQKTPGIGLDKYCDSQPGLARYIKRNPKLSFVATVDHALVGAVLSGHDGRRGYLHHLAVLPQFRKQGIAKKLVSKCFKQLHKNHIPKCNIFLFKSNSSGLSFWKHNRWTLRRDLSVLQKTTEKA